MTKLNKAPYPDDWVQISYRTRQARNWECEQCGISQGEELNNPIGVHHIDYNPQNNHLDNLIVLCAKCHLRRQQHELQQRNITQKRLDLIHAGQLSLPGI